MEPSASGYLPTTYTNDPSGLPQFAKIGGYAWAVPFPGVIRWLSASCDVSDGQIMAMEVYRAGAPIHAWILPPLQPIPASAAAGAGFPNDYDAAVFEPLGNLTVISGDEIRVVARNANPISEANIAVSVGVIFTSNTGTVTVNSFEVDYVPR
jgi:hypothetical protein